MIFYFKRSTPLMYTAALRPVPYERIRISICVAATVDAEYPAMARKAKM